MAIKIFLTKSAEKDLIAGYDFYEHQAQRLGDYFLDSLFADVDALMLFAGIHPKPDGVFCRALAKRFPFAIYYRINGDVVTVEAILDCRQNPSQRIELLRHRV